LSARLEVVADAALALEWQQELVEQPALQHALVQANQPRRRQVRHARRIGLAILVQNLQ